MATNRRTFTLLAVVLGLLGAAYLALNMIPRPVPAPLWTAADLPAMPAAADNGWHAARPGVEDIDIPEDLQTLLGERDEGPAAYWDEAAARHAAVREFLAGAEARAALERLAAAEDRPAFAEDCGVDEPCSLIGWFEMHRVALLEALALTLADDPAAALERLHGLIRVDLAHVEGSRSTLGFIIALSNLEHALALTERVVARLPAGERPAVELVATIRALETSAFGLEAAVIFDYLHVVEMIDEVMAGEGEQPRWLFDHAATLAEANARFERRHAAAVAGDTFGALGGNERSPTEGVGWWLRNPGGKQLLAAMAFEPSSLAESIDERLAAIDSLRSRLLAAGG